jgi:hypothetical protein
MKLLTFCLLFFTIFGVSNTKQQLKLFDSKPQFKDNSSNNRTTVEQKEPPYFHLLNFLKYMVLGPPKNSSQKLDIFDIIKEAPDDTDLLTMIIDASENLNQFLKKNKIDEDIFEG